MIAVLPLLFLITIILITSRVAAVALESTGMARDSAQFQARSALMGVGYTTSESEDITAHPVRRRIVLNLMTFGNVTLVTGVGGLLLTFVNTETAQSLQRSAVLVGAVIVILLAFHSSVANRIIESLTRMAISRFTSLDVRDYAALLQIEKSHALTEIHVRDGEWMAGHTLADLHLTREGVVVLGIHRDDGAFIGTPNGDTSILPGDEVLAYGRIDCLKDLAIRPAATGDLAHEQNVAKHERQLHEGD